MNNKTKIVTFAHCKGGVGKSTLCCHITTALKMYNPNLKIGLLDLDHVQNTSYNYFMNKITPNSLDFLSKSHDINELQHIIPTEELDILIIDTAGGANEITENAIQLTNILVTPMQHSLIDIKALVDLEHSKIIDGPFKKIINKNTNKNFKWLLVNNKLPLVNMNDEYKDLIEQIAFRFGARLFYVYDRPEYRMSFEPSHYTPSEVVNYRNDFTRGQKAAALEIDSIYKIIMNYIK